MGIHYVLDVFSCRISQTRADLYHCVAYSFAINRHRGSSGLYIQSFRLEVRSIDA